MMLRQLYNLLGRVPVLILVVGTAAVMPLAQPALGAPPRLENASLEFQRVRGLRNATIEFEYVRGVRNATIEFERLRGLRNASIEFAVLEKIVDVASVLDHGGTDLSLELCTTYVEPRMDGVLEIECEVSGPVSTVNAQVSCVNNLYVGTITTTSNVTTVTVEFAPALPDEDCCEVTLSGDVTDSFQVRPLRGDINRDGLVTTGDASIIKPHFGDVPTDADAEFDFDVSGLISTGDFSQVKPLFGHTAPECP